MKEFVKTARSAFEAERNKKPGQKAGGSGKKPADKKPAPKPKREPVEKGFIKGRDPKAMAWGVAFWVAVGFVLVKVVF